LSCGTVIFRRTYGTHAFRFQEADDFHDRPDILEIFRDFLDTLGKSAFLCKQKTIRLAKRMNGLAVKSAALQPDKVKPRKIGTVTDHRTIRNDIAFNTSHAADHRMFANADKL